MLLGITACDKNIALKNGVHVGQNIGQVFAAFDAKKTTELPAL